MARILIVSTAHDTLGETGKRTGVWLEELAVPYLAFREAGHEAVVATLDGSAIPVDPSSEPTGDDVPEAIERFRADPEAQQWMQHPAQLADQTPQSFDAIYIPGGHGAMWDLAQSEPLAMFIADAWEMGKIVASVCHGPAALVDVDGTDGRPLVEGRKMAAFTDSEERAVGLQDAVPFLLESRLRERGAQVVTGEDWAPHALADGRLVTGQNPASSAEAARLVLDRL